MLTTSFSEKTDDLLEYWLDALGDRIWTVGTGEEVREAGQDADVRLLSDLGQGGFEQLQGTAVDDIAVLDCGT